jgi:glycogen synthase
MRLDHFWNLLASTPASHAIAAAPERAGKRYRALIKDTIADFAQTVRDNLQIKNAQEIKVLTDFKWIFTPDDSVVIVYKLQNQLFKVIRLCNAGLTDAMSTGFACSSVRCGSVRTDIFHDHGHWISEWIGRLQANSKDPSLKILEQMLLSEDIHNVRSAIDQLAKKIRRKESLQQTCQMLYAALYYWNNPDKGICRSICLEVSALLEDILTERPFTFPASRINRSVFRSESADVTIQIRKPRNVAKDNLKVCVQWSVNGRRKKAIPMTPVGGIREGGVMTFSAVFPVRSGWIHYSVQFSTDGGQNWQWEELDENSHGLLKYIADERGQRVLSFYADTFNLKIDDQYKPVKDENGMFVYGTFADIADQLEAIRDEGYTRIYPLGALELGWAGEAGPDPSVFSVFDGRTVRQDLGGLEGLMRLRERADALGMKVLLCVLSHFSRANTSFRYQLPVYIVNDKGTLSPRAGWDGEWSEWLDSFMVNMRDFSNVDYLAKLGVELTSMGFGLRIDVGHGFDTVFPVHPDLRGTARLLGETVEKGFEAVDLRGTEEANIPLLYLCYKVQKAVPSALLVYSEQWHGNETRMIKSGTTPYNSLIKNLEHIRSGQEVDAPLGLNDNFAYLNTIYHRQGGQTLSLFNSHDEESPASNYQNMIWPAAALLVLSCQGPMMYHMSRLPGPEAGTMRQRFDEAYTECWKHWVNNRFRHPWDDENRARWQIIAHYPILFGFGKYLRRLFKFVDKHPAFIRGELIPIQTQNTRIAAFLRLYKGQVYLCLFNFPEPYSEGQFAVSRAFNFTLQKKSEDLSTQQIRPENIYEIVELYNNTESRTRQGGKEFWSGQELTSLGFGGLIDPVSSHVYEILEKKDTHSRQQLWVDSFVRYLRYGKDDRVRHTYIAKTFCEVLDSNIKEGYPEFTKLFVVLTEWIHKKRKLGLSTLSLLLKEISEDDSRRRKTVIQYLMRIAVNEKSEFQIHTCHAAADILHGMNLGTIALVSPESQYSGHAGGVGIYTTDIADVLSELGFHVVVVTPLYERHRDKIIKNYMPRYDGHSFTVRFPEFDEHTQSISRNTTPDVVNILHSSLLRQKHGKRTRVEVLYLENGKYLDAPYGGQTGEDKLRRARVLSQGALEALRAYNYYPTIIQTNEWPTWLVPAYLQRWPEYNTDPHFQNTHVVSMMHNPHPSYSIKMEEANPFRKYYYCLVLGMDAVVHADACINPDAPSGGQIDMTYMMLRNSHHIGTVSRAMKQRILDEPQVFGYASLFRQMETEGRFFGRRNGFNMAARQRFWFRSKKSILEAYDAAARKRLFAKYTHAKKLAKAGLQNDPNIRLKPDDNSTKYVIFSMLHRICKQKGFELLLDWKVYEDNGKRWVVYEPWKMMGPTVLEYFLSRDERIQYVVCGSVEDSFDGRRFDMHFQRIRSLPQFQGRFAYYPQGALSPSLYRNVYVGSQYFVMPSGGEVGEPCGISQQEAHAGGTPVVAHHQDGLIRTVCDADFGDTESPPNGIKFRGFNGESLLMAMLDAVEVYYNNQRLLYTDKKGKPRKLRYADLSYNAFNTDHRWLRLLRDYVKAYCLMSNVELPEHVQAVRLITDAASVSDHDLPDIILKHGMQIPEAIGCLVDALSCPVLAVRDASAKVLLRLYDAFESETDETLKKFLIKSVGASPQNKYIEQLCSRLKITIEQ